MEPLAVSSTDNRWLFILAVLLAATIFVFPLTVPFPLLDPDEGLHASIALEMAERGDWLTPHFLGDSFFDKPVLYFWCQALSLKAFGATEAAVRLPGLMLALLGAITTGVLGRQMFGRTAGWVAGIFYGTMILPVAMAQAATHDVALVPCVNLALLFLWESQRARSNRALSGYTAATGLLLGIAILAKGLMGVALVAVAYGLYVVITRRLSLAVCLRFLAALVIAAAVAATWYVPMEIKHPGFLYYYFIERHFWGFATATQAHGEAPWWYYVPVVLGGGLPWIGYLPVTIRDALARRADSSDAIYAHADRNGVQGPRCVHLGLNSVQADAMALLFCWLVGCTVLLSVAHSKLLTYIWPVFPAVAMLAAAPWARFLDGELGENARRSLLRTFVFSSATGPIVLPLVVFVVHKVFAVEFSPFVWIAALLAGLAALAPLVFLQKHRWGTVPIFVSTKMGLSPFAARAMLAASLLSVAVQFVVALTVVLPPVAEGFTARSLARYFNGLGRLPVRLLVAHERLGSLVFYLDPALRGSLADGQIAMLSPDERGKLPPGTIIALPEIRAAQAVKYPQLSGLTYKTIGRYRLYEVRQ